MAHRVFHRGRHFQEEGSYEAAIREFRRVTCCPHHRRTALYSLAECYLKSRQSEEALGVLREIVGRYPDDAMGPICLGQLLLKRGEHAEGLKMLDQGLELSRVAVARCLGRSRGALAEGQPQRAAREVVLAARYLGQQVRLQQWLVRLYLDRGEIGRALQVLAPPDGTSGGSQPEDS